MVNLILMNAQIFKNCFADSLKASENKSSVKLNSCNVSKVHKLNSILLLNFKRT